MAKPQIKTPKRPNVKRPMPRNASSQASAPVKRGPGRPRKAAPEQTEPAKPAVVRGVVKAPRANAAAPVAAKPSADQSAEIKALKATIAKLTADVAAAKTATKGKLRTREQIVDGISVPSSDWRGEYHGQEITLFRATPERDDSLTIHKTDNGDAEAGQPPMLCLLAIPRDSDLGGKGASARKAGRLAVHSALSEDGSSFVEQPLYITIEELAEMWAE